MSEWWLYMLECRGGGIYVGITKDVAKRYEKHRKGSGATYTRINPPIRLLANQPYPSRRTATKAEVAMKRLKPLIKWAWARKIASGIYFNAGQPHINDADPSAL